MKVKLGSTPARPAPRPRGGRFAPILALLLAQAAPLAALLPQPLPADRPVILITGSTNGLGREVARRLARTGAHIVVHGRNVERGREVVEEIEAEGIGSARFYAADFASLEEVRELARRISSDYDRLDVLINNAGIGPGPRGEPRRLSADGQELRFQVNYLAGFLLTRLLLPLLSDSARIVNVTSRFQEPIDFEDLTMETRYSGGLAYGRSKLAQILFTFDLAEELKGTGIVVSAVHPAPAMDTDLLRRVGGEPQSTVEDGVRSVLNVLTTPRLKSGQYFHETDAARAHPQAYDAMARERLRRMSEVLTAVPP